VHSHQALLRAEVAALEASHAASEVQWRREIGLLCQEIGRLRAQLKKLVRRVPLSFVGPWGGEEGLGAFAPRLGTLCGAHCLKVHCSRPKFDLFAHLPLGPCTPRLIAFHPAPSSSSPLVNTAAG